MMSQPLSPEQAQALFEILSHHEAYQELRDLRAPGALAQSGPPFKTTASENEMPLLHALFFNYIVPLPGLRDVSSDFWQAKCQEIIEELAKADLSESYEAGYIGIRKTLATAAASVIESPARGFYGGFPRTELSRKDAKYDTSNPEDIVAAFQDFLQRMVYDTLIDEMFARAAETDKLEEHDPLVQAAHEYILVILASFLHYILIITPEGQTILTMIKQANALVPYTAARQTLKIGNAATMINGMMKLLLTKMTMNSVTTFLGITNASDAGWNLLQTIIYTVVNWDTGTLNKRSAEIEKSSDGPSKAQRDVLKAYMEKGRDEQEKCRAMSEAKSEPVVVTILEEYDGDELNEKQIPLALDYLSVQVSLRDRRKIVSILCSRQPDLVTQAIREGVAAYDPVIRGLHKAVDLSSTLYDLQVFLDDLLIYAPSGKSSSTASVADFVKLLRKHQGSSHRFIHQLCKNGPELRDWYKEYAKMSAQSFRMADQEEANSTTGGAGAGKLTKELNSIYLALSEKQQQEVAKECDAYYQYLNDLSSKSQQNMRFEVEHDPPPKKLKKSLTGFSSKPATRETSREASPTRPSPGPGMFLRRWQAYLNDTIITPAKIGGPVRHGDDPDVITAGRLPINASTRGVQAMAASDESVKAAPSCAKTVQYLGMKFRQVLRESAKSVSTDQGT